MHPFGLQQGTSPHLFEKSLDRAPKFVDVSARWYLVQMQQREHVRFLGPIHATFSVPEQTRGREVPFALPL
jgi:hypothetical protein